MKCLNALFLLFALTVFGAVPSYTVFRGTGGILITSNPPTGNIVFDGSGIFTSSGTNATIAVSTNGVLVMVAATNVNFVTGSNVFLAVSNISSTAHIGINAFTPVPYIEGAVSNYLLTAILPVLVVDNATITNLGAAPPWSAVQYNSNGVTRGSPGFIYTNGQVRVADIVVAGQGMEITAGSLTLDGGATALIAWNGLGNLRWPSSGVARFEDQFSLGLNRIQLGGDTAAFPAIGRTNGDVIILGGNGAFKAGDATNKLRAPAVFIANDSGMGTPLLRLENPLNGIGWDLAIGAHAESYLLGLGLIDQNYQMVWELTSGNVGIGITNPTVRLDVQGRFMARSNVYFPNISSNALPVAFLATDSQGEVYETAIPTVTASPETNAVLTNLIGTVARNVTNVVSLSTSNATSKPLTNSYTAGVLTLFGVEAGANVTVTPNGSNLVIAATGGGGTPGGNSAAIQFNHEGAFAGTNTLVFDRTNNRVGIGIATPLYPLDVQAPTGIQRLVSTTGANEALQLFVSDGSALVGLESSVPGTTVAGSSAHSLLLANQYAYPVQIATDNSVRMTVLPTNGYVGISTVSPTNALDVNGHASIRSNLFLANLPTNGSPIAFLATDAAGAVYETAVPIGGGGGAGSFAVNDDQFVTNALLNFKSGALVTNLNIKAAAGASTALTVDTNVLVVTAGKVGIGTASPGFLLTVASTGNGYNPGIVFNGGTYGFSPSSTTGFGWANGSVYALEFIPGALTVPSATSFQWASGASAAQAGADTRLYRASAGYVGTTNLYVSGNVGIGTNAPAARLTVTADNSVLNVVQFGTTNKPSLATLTTNGVFAMSELGAVGTPVIVVGGDLDSGIWSSAGNTLNFSAGGAEKFKITTASLIGRVVFAGASGTVASPGYQFDNDSTSGTWLVGAHSLGFATWGTNRVTIDAEGDVSIGVTQSTNALSVLGTAWLGSNVFLPNLRTNASPIAFLATDAAGAVYETAVPAGGAAFSGHSNAIPYINAAGTALTYYDPGTSQTNPGFGFNPTQGGGPHGGFAGLMVFANEPQGLVTIGHPGISSDFSTLATALCISNRYAAAGGAGADGEFKNDMVKIDAVLVNGTNALRWDSTMTRWRVWQFNTGTQTTISSNDVAELTIRGVLTLEGGLPTNNAAFTITTNNFALDTYYTNMAQRSWVSASIGMTNVLLTEKAWVGLYLDQDGDGTWERTGINVRLQGISALAGVEQLSAFLQPSARFIFTNLGTTANSSIEANSSQWVKQ